MMVSWNGQLMDEADVFLSVNNAIFLRGEGVFETIRVVAGAPLFWKNHYDRLAGSAALFLFDLSGCQDLEKQVVEVVKANNLQDARVRITVGESILITAQKLEPGGDTVTAVLGSDVPINEQSPLAGVKCTSYAENMLLLRRSEAEEVLRPNTRGELCEGCLSNVFFILNGKLCTPSLETGCLPGVMRSQVIAHVEVEEGKWPFEILHEAEEIWLSNSVRKLRFVTRLEGCEFGETTPFFREVRDLIS